MGASSCVELECAACAEVSQADAIARYASLRQAGDATIGDLVPARRDLEDEHWWGHAGGDVDWWYRMPQYKDATREVTLVRQERDMFLRQANHYAQSYVEKLSSTWELEKRLRDAGIAT